MSASPAATMLVTSVPRGFISMLILSAMPSRGKRSFLSQMPLVLPGSAIFLAPAMVCLKAATVLTSGLGAFARTAMPRGNLREVHVRSAGDLVGGDQFGETLSGQDHHVGGYALCELSGDGLRTAALRRARSGRDLDPTRPLEFRQ